MNLRQQIAESEAVRLKFLSGKPFSEADFRNVLSPDADYKKQLDSAMELVLALTAHIQLLREQIDRRPSPIPRNRCAIDFDSEIQFLKDLEKKGKP